MKLLPKQAYSLPVVGKTEEGNNQYYIVENDGVEYRIRLYEFQHNRPVPEQLLCRIVPLQDGSLILSQDYSMFIDEFYKVGGVYPFKVTSIHNVQGRKSYKIRDKYGFNFRLLDHSDAHLNLYEEIECKVTSIDGWKMRTRLVNHEAAVSAYPFYTVNHFVQIVGDKSIVRLGERALRKSPLLNEALEAYESKQGIWLLYFMRVAKKHFRAESLSWQNSRRVIKALVDVSLYILEGSDYLKNLDMTRRRRSREILENYIRRSTTLIEAIDIIHSGDEENVIGEIISKMKNSGYLFDPAKKLELLISIFKLKPEIVESNMTQILEIITEGNHANWTQEPFRSAFMRQLDFYVRLVKEKADRASYEDSRGRMQIQRMMQALAIRALMAGKYDHNSYLQVDRSSLFRYLTYENVNIGHQLLERAFMSVTDSANESPEYGWSDINDLKKLSLLLSRGIDNTAKTVTTQVFEGTDATLQVTNDHIHISSIHRKKDLKPLLPNDLLPWHGIQIYCAGKLPSAPAEGSHLEKYRSFWRDVERMLFHPDFNELSRQSEHPKSLPEINDRVNIVIDGAVEGSTNTFYCHIVEETLKGEGIIRLGNMVKFINSVTDLSIFCNEEGKPYILPADVMNIRKDGSIEFSMSDVVSEYLEDLDYGSDLTCMVLGSMPNYRDRDGNVSKGYIGFSSDGDSVMCLYDGPDPGLTIGSVFEGSVEYISDPKYNQVICKFKKRVSTTTPITRDDAFSKFLYNISDGQVLDYTPSQEDEEEEEDYQFVGMEEDCVRELIRIIDRVATLESNYIKVFNYLSFCRIMALLLGDEELAEYYLRRFNFLRSLETFVDSGVIRTDDLRLDDEEYMDYPLIRDRAKQMRVLSYFDKPENNDQLWEIISEEHNENTVALAKLTLLSNMSMEFEFNADMRSKINREMSRLLKIEVSLPELVSFGSEETQTLEFKTSYLYDQENHYDPDRQADHIAERVCGFLNSAQGGSLYIGVNNYGFASGLDQDMSSPYMKSYARGNKNPEDVYDLKVRNDLRSRLGAVANEFISSKWIGAGTKRVYLIEVSPCPTPISFEGAFWIRQGTSTYRHDFDAYNKIVRARKSAASPEAVSQPSAADDTSAAVSSYDNEALSEVPNDQNIEPVTAPDTITKESAVQPMTENVSESEDLSHSSGTVYNGKTRPNTRNEWEENYIIPDFQLNFLSDGQYNITKEVNWETEDYLAIRNSEMPLYIVLVYDDGGVIRVPVAEVANKDYDRLYARYKDRQLIFASIGSQEDSLFIMYNQGDKQVARVEQISDLKSGSMTDAPESVTTGDYDSVATCDIIPAGKTDKLKPLIKISRSKTGNGMNAIVNRQLNSLGVSLSGIRN